MQSAGGRTDIYDLAGRTTDRNGTVIEWNGDCKPSAIGNVGFTYDSIGNRLKNVSSGEITRYPFPALPDRLVKTIAFIEPPFLVRCFETGKREIMRGRTRWKLCLKKTEVHETWLPTN